MPLAPRDLRREQGRERPTVEEPGEGVGARQPLRLLDEHGHLDGPAELARDDVHQRLVPGLETVRLGAHARAERQARDDRVAEGNLADDRSQPPLVDARVLVLHPVEPEVGGDLEGRAGLALGGLAALGVRVDPEAPGSRSRRRHVEADPSVAREPGEELREQIEEPLDLAAHREGAHLGRHDRLEERGVEVGRDPITDVEVRAAELGEERRGSGRAGDGIGDRPHEVAHPALLHVGGGARSLRPEPVAAGERTAEDDRHVLGRRLRAEEPTELHAGDTGHPQIGDDDRRRLGERDARPFGRARRGIDVVALHAQARREDVAGRLTRIDQDHARTVHRGSLTLGAKPDYRASRWTAATS